MLCYFVVASIVLDFCIFHINDSLSSIPLFHSFRSPGFFWESENLRFRLYYFFAIAVSLISFTFIWFDLYEAHYCLKSVHILQYPSCHIIGNKRACVCVFVHDILGIIRLTRFPFSAFPWSSQRFQSVGRMVEWRTRAHNSTFTARYIIHMQFVLIVPHAILNSILSPSFVSSHFNLFFSYRSYSLSLSQSKFLIPVSISFTPVAFPLSNRIISAHLADACISMSVHVNKCSYIDVCIFHLWFMIVIAITV